MKKTIFFVFLKRKIERKFWKLSAPYQIVTCPLKLKHNFKKTYFVLVFFWKIKLEGILVAPSIELLPLKAY